MERNAEKTKVMTNNTEGIRRGIRINNKRLDRVIQFNYLVVIIRDEDS